MSVRFLEWALTDPTRRAAIERALARPAGEGLRLHTGPQRTLDRLELEQDGERGSEERDVIVVKRYRRRRGIRSVREYAKRGFGRSPAEREWRALVRARALALPVPAPLALGRDAVGEDLLITSFVPGSPLDAALAAADPAGRDALVEDLVATVRSLHATGLVHGDLHAGNLRVGPQGVVLLDLQRMRRARVESDHRTDWARLAFSLERSPATSAFEPTLRERAGLGADFDSARVRFLRDYQRGRARRHLRSGRRWRSIPAAHGHAGELEGTLGPAELLEATRDLSPETCEQTRRDGRVRIHRLEMGERRLVCKAVDADTPARSLADGLRGSAASRGFRRGQRDRLISNRSAPALGRVERRSWRGPRTSWLVMEEVGDVDLDAFVPDSPASARGLLEALAEWIAEQHARGLSHRDFKAGNVRVGHVDGAPRFWLVDLEDLTGPVRLSEEARIEALVQLNASLADAHFDAGSRRAALERYAARLPFRRPLPEVTGEIARRSLARRHRWQGADCPCAVRTGTAKVSGGVASGPASP